MAIKIVIDPVKLIASVKTEKIDVVINKQELISISNTPLELKIKLI